MLEKIQAQMVEYIFQCLNKVDLSLTRQELIDIISQWDNKY